MNVPAESAPIIWDHVLSLSRAYINEKLSTKTLTKKTIYTDVGEGNIHFHFANEQNIFLLMKSYFYDYFVTSFFGSSWKFIVALRQRMGVICRNAVSSRIPCHYYGNNYLSSKLWGKKVVNIKAAQENMEIKCCWWWEWRSKMEIKWIFER